MQTYTNIENLNFHLLFVFRFFFLCPGAVSRSARPRSIWNVRPHAWSCARCSVLVALRLFRVCIAATIVLPKGVCDLYNVNLVFSKIQEKKKRQK